MTKNAASTPLWTLGALREATGGTLAGAICDGEISGISIDTRTLAPGDLFVALKDARDGHEFVSDAFGKGAAAALVGENYAAKPGDGPLLCVPDVLQALERIGIAARARLSPQAHVIAVTGSVGKTTTKEMLRTCLAAQGPTHAADKSFNNHWGVPLTLARMPANTRFGVFEIGMNHSGEITPLVKMVRPHVAVVTTVEPVHIEHFGSIQDIAEAKAEIFSGIEAGGTAVIPRDNPFCGLLVARAREHSLKISLFGTSEDSHVHLIGTVARPTGSYNTASIKGLMFSFELGLSGRHMTHNALAVAAVFDAIGLFPTMAMAPLAHMSPPQGRGSRTVLSIEGAKALLIDETYNANPASMRAALAATAGVDRKAFPRRIAVLGDMLELGEEKHALHAGLASDIAENGIDLLFACGESMKHLYDAVPAAKQGLWAANSSGLTAGLLGCVKGGDVVMIKGSNGSRMAPLVAALTARHNPTHSLS